jgi:D-alanine-D-alanine ligase
MTSTEFFDFEAKYKGASSEVTPAEFTSERTAKIQELVRMAHEACGCNVYSRSDVRIDKQGNIYVLETNTLPGMTPSSLLPQQAACIGLSYSQLLDVLIETSLQVER